MKNYILKIKKFLKNEKNDILLSLLMGISIFVSFIVLNQSYAYSMNIKKNIADNVIRFHVLANSDTNYDQELKIYVKDMILDKYKSDLIKLSTREEAIDFFNQNMKNIENYAESLVKDKGYDYDVKCELAYTQFPTKSYNDITLPKGEYLAFRVLIGDYSGENFWCVLYPPLCYVEAVDQDNFDYAKNKLEDDLTEEEFLIISETNSPFVKVKFKIIEMFNS